MQENKKRLIEFINLIFPMPLEQAAAIAEYFSEKSFSKNEFILKEGRICNEYHFLCEGFMRAWTTDLEGRDVTTAFHPAGFIVCELSSFFKRSASRENIQALEDSTTLFITYNNLQDAFHSMHAFREFGRTILVNAYISLKQRVLSGLHETAEQRYRNLMAATPEIFQYASLKHIASYLGITDTSLSRIRKEFAKEHQQ